MNDKNRLDHHCPIHPNKRISWTAIFVGAFTALGLGFLLNLLGIAIGLSALKIISNGSITLAYWDVLAIIFGVVLSMFVAGYVAGYLGRLYCPERNLGIIYGFTTWVMALILTAAIIGHLGQYVSTYRFTYTNTIPNTVVAVQVNQIATPVGIASITTPTKQGEQALVQVNVTPNELVSGAFIVFALFFLGALFTCFGACWGMRRGRDDV
ncbi:MAG: hypothetical protein ACRCXC_04775 [Legionella sp.]